MTGLQMTSMTLDEMRAARERGEDRSDWERVRREAHDGIEPADDEDSPDASELMRSEVAKRRAGRPSGTGNKEQIAIRLDFDILVYFRATGAGWQTRMNEALRDWIKSHSPT
ncbi:BrnA antitoxin family protein [Gammaproteobacteria bacterium]